MGQWNAGHGFLCNKMDEMCQILQDYGPKILGISESCHLKTHSQEDISIQGYSLILSNTIHNSLIEASRVTVYIHHELSYKIRQDLMSDSFSSIWIEVGRPGQKKILVCMLYR